MDTSGLQRTRARRAQGLSVLMVMVIGPGFGWGSPPRETFPLPFFSFDRESPAVSATGADSILVHDTDAPTVVYSGAGLAMGRLNDDLDAL